MAKKKRIELHTDAELAQAIKAAEAAFPKFWIVVYGIHAFFEQRRRKVEKIKDLRMERLRILLDEEWGSD